MQDIKLPLFSVINLQQLKELPALNGTQLTDFALAQDQHVYLLLERSCAVPEGADSSALSWITSPSDYIVVDINIDWANQSIVEWQVYPLGVLKYQFHFVRPVGDNLLLLGARSAFDEKSPDRNAWLVSRTGDVLAKYCLGDGIQNCVITQDDSIVTGYFDEGVFGNFGWEEPLGAHGLNIWSNQGELLWSDAKRRIVDCYALNLDAQNRIWFYYYDDFDLVGIKPDAEEIELMLPLDGCKTFAVADDGQSFVFDQGYNHHNQFCFLKRQGDSLKPQGMLIPTFQDKQVHVGDAHMLGSKMLFLSDKGSFYASTIESLDVLK